LGVRRHEDITGPEMARALGVSSETVRSWEAGETRPRQTLLGRLADYLGVNPAWLHYGSGPKARGAEIERPDVPAPRADD